jgi:hypothetical protein
MFAKILSVRIALIYPKKIVFVKNVFIMLLNALNVGSFAIQIMNIVVVSIAKIIFATSVLILSMKILFVLVV